MPKVETEYILVRGTNQKNKRIKNLSKKYVSNTVGNFFYVNDTITLQYPNEENVNELKRIKRNAETETEIDDVDSVAQHPITHRRKVKIIRRRPKYLTNHNLDNSIIINRDVEVWDDNRRRVIVTKKRKINITPHTTNAVNSRRRVVVTKKRLLRPSEVFGNANEDTEFAYPEEPESTAVAPAEIFSTITDNFYHITPELEIESDEATDTTPYVLPESTEHVLSETSEYSVTESTDVPLFEIYTTLLSEYVTSTYTRNKTYTYVVTRVHENEQLITSTTSVKADVKTETMTLTHTLTLTKPITFSDGPTLSNINSKDSIHRLRSLDINSGLEEGRYNIATRVMSNGVEVIVAGDKSTSASDINMPHFVGHTAARPFALNNNRQTQKFKGILARDVDSRDEKLSPSIPANQFITKTLLTTYTYLTTYLQAGTTTVSSHERVIANTATEERNMVKIMPTPTVGITLTENPNLAVGVFHTTYTYLNTIHDGEVPLTETTKHTVANTVTAPDDYLSLLQPSEPTTAVLDTNTYYSTVALTTTLKEGNSEKVVSSTNTVTQVVITESTPPRGMSVMTSYIALDVEDLEPSAVASIATTDVVKTHYVTYTYYNTYLEHGSTVVRTNVSTSTDIVTEKLYLHLKRTQTDTASQKIIKTNSLENNTVHDNEMQIFATKTYLTTFTYFTTLLKSAPNDQTTTVINSHTRVVENVVVESSTDEPSDFTSMASLTQSLVSSVTDAITPTVLKETLVEPSSEIKNSYSSTSPSVITGSTIIFFDDDEIEATPVMEMLTKTLDEPEKISLNTENETKVFGSKSKAPVNILTSNITRTISATKTVSTKIQTNSAHLKGSENLHSNKTASNKVSPKPNKPELQDLLGSLSINSFTALRPVINAMADMIHNNLNANRRNDSVLPATSPRPRNPFLQENQSTQSPNESSELKNRSPIYIPVGGLSDDKIEAAESQNFAQLSLNLNTGPPEKWTEQIESRHKNHIVIGKPTHESPLLNGGIHISPGEVITANSDVIVGRPAIMGPRIPLDASKFIQPDESAIGMHPPPIPIGSQTSALYTEHSLDNVKSGSNRDDYFGPPPAMPQVPFRRKPHPHQKYRDHAPEKFPPRRERPYPQVPQAPLPGSIAENNRYKINGPSIIPLHYEYNDNRDSGTKHSYVISVNEPNRERVPAQDNLRVPIQTLQGEIPPASYDHGSVFEDPSPLPEPENGSGFVGVDNYNNDAAQSASSHNNNVHGKINFDNNVNVEATRYGSLNKGEYYGIRDITINTNSASPNYGYSPTYQSAYDNKPNVVENRPVNIGNSYISTYPPTQVVKHVVTEGIVLDAPLDNEPGSTIIHAHRPNLQTTNDVPLSVSHNRPNDFNKILNIQKTPIYTTSHDHIRGRPAVQNKPIRNFYHDQTGKISQFMTPPPPRAATPVKSAIPVYAVPIGVYNSRPHTPQELDFYRDNIINGNYQGTKVHGESIIDDSIVDDHKEDDVANEEGEVVQESNQRPLFPGEIPTEIIKTSSIPTNTNRPVVNTQTEAGHNILNEYTTTTHGYEVREQNLPQKNPTIQVNPRPFSRPNNNMDMKETYSLNPPKIPQTQRPVMLYPNWKPPQNNKPNGGHSVLIAKPNIVKPNLYYQNDKRIYGFGNKAPTVITPTYSMYPIYDIKPGMPFMNTNQYPTQQGINKKPNLIPHHSTTYNSDSTPGSSIKISHKQHPNASQTNISIPEVNQATPTRFANEYEVPNNTNFVDIMRLNTGEIATQKPDFGDLETDSQSEIFDFKESTHPHNLGSLRPHVFNNNSTFSDIHIDTLRPPPPSIEYENYSSSNVINKSVLSSNVTVYENAETTTATNQIYIPKPSEDMKPPPVVDAPPSIIRNEEVVGLSPPPPSNVINHSMNLPNGITESGESNTNTRFKDPNAHKPVYTTTTKPVPPYIFETPNTNSGNVFYGPTSNRPNIDAIDFEVSADELDTSTQNPSTEFYEISTPDNNRVKFITESTTKEQDVTTDYSHTTSNHKTNQNVILNDSLDSGSEPVKTFVPANRPDIRGENKYKHTVTIGADTRSSSIDLSPRKTVNPSVINTTPITHEIKTPQTSKTPLFSDESSTRTRNTQTYKISQTAVKESDTHNKIRSTSIYSSKPIIPTRYITHTQTLTVTSTKTTVIKSQGSPPSTLTLVLTKTQTSTIIDTVTEIHTLVQPTSIIETVTTTVNSLVIPTAVPHPHQPIARPDIKKIIISSEDDELNEFIINDDDTDTEMKNYSRPGEESNENESIFVVLTDKNMHGNHGIPTEMQNVNMHDILNNHENLANEVNRVLLGGVLIDTPPHLQPQDVEHRPNECRPECKSTFNELCQRFEGIMRCVCRPGFARMFPDRPCKPTYTFTVQLGLARNGKQNLRYTPALADRMSPAYVELAAATHEGLDRMIMQSDLRDVYHGLRVTGFQNTTTGHGVLNSFFIQLSENTDEQHLKKVVKNYLHRSNYSIGGTEVYSAREFENNLVANDFDECLNHQFHDCSENAQCFNLRGTYTCSCKEGFADLSANPLYPGRTCSAELVGCEKCHYHGTCYNRGEDQMLCECFQWYAGENCHINLKVLLIALVTLGTLFCTLLLICVILACCKKRQPSKKKAAGGISFLQQRTSGGHHVNVTLDKRAMIQDTSSEGSQSDTNTLPYVAKKSAKNKNSASKKIENQLKSDLKNGSYDQQDRSLTVMIPRAKYHPHPTTSPLLNIEALDRRKSTTSSNEAKLLSYLDAGVSGEKSAQSRKNSNQSGITKSGVNNTPSIGALVSAGFEVSATVVGTEADRSENATLIHKIRSDFHSTAGSQSQFTTAGKSRSHEDLIDPLGDWLDVTPRAGELTVSEARSYDETTIQPMTKTLRSIYDSKPPSHHHNNDEANTMAERDLGSTFLLPHTHLYKPDRGSDISGFDSL